LWVRWEDDGNVSLFVRDQKTRDTFICNLSDLLMSKFQKVPCPCCGTACCDLGWGNLVPKTEFVHQRIQVLDGRTLILHGACGWIPLDRYLIMNNIEL
jgi:hypothetical protein